MESNKSIQLLSFRTTCSEPFIDLGVHTMGVKSSTTSSSGFSFVSDLYFLASFLLFPTINIGTRWELLWTILLLTRCIDFINALIDVVIGKAGTMSYCTTLRVTRQRYLFLLRPNVIVPHSVSLVSNGVHISGMSHCKMCSGDWCPECRLWWYPNLW